MHILYNEVTTYEGKVLTTKDGKTIDMTKESIPIIINEDDYREHKDHKIITIKGHEFDYGECSVALPKNRIIGNFNKFVISNNRKQIPRSVLLIYEKQCPRCNIPLQFDDRHEQLFLNKTGYCFSCATTTGHGAFDKEATLLFHLSADRIELTKQRLYEIDDRSVFNQKYNSRRRLIQFYWIFSPLKINLELFEKGKITDTFLGLSVINQMAEKVI